MVKQVLLQLNIEKDEDAYTASCPALPGCISWGKTYDDAYNNIKEAVLCYLEGLDKIKKSKYAFICKSKPRYAKALSNPSMVVAL